MGSVEESCRYRARWVSIRGKLVLSTNPGYKPMGGGGRHMIKLSSEPWVAYPEVKVQVRDLVRVVGIAAPFVPMGGQYSGIICLSSPRGYMGTGDLCRVLHPPAVRHGRARQSSGTGPCGDCRKIPCVPGPRGQCSGKIRFIEKPRVQD